MQQRCSAACTPRHASHNTRVGTLVRWLQPSLVACPCAMRMLAGVAAAPAGRCQQWGHSTLGCPAPAWHRAAGDSCCCLVGLLAMPSSGVKQRHVTLLLIDISTVRHPCSSAGQVVCGPPCLMLVHSHRSSPFTSYCLQPQICGLWWSPLLFCGLQVSWAGAAATSAALGRAWCLHEVMLARWVTGGFQSCDECGAVLLNPLNRCHMCNIC